MSDEAVVRISRDKPTELEFQVVVKGAEDLAAQTAVRFVIAKVDGTHDLVFHAAHITEDTWRVEIPVLEHVDDGSYDVRIEVIIDNYFFEPAQGQIVLRSDPHITMPSVVSSDKKDKKGKKVKVQERAPGTGTAFGGMEAPTTKNLRPSFPPATKHVEKDEEEDNKTKKKKLPFVVKPGQGPAEPQDDGKDDVDDELNDTKKTFNPQHIAEQIIMKTLGLNKQQRRAIANRPGYLFKRGPNGKPVVAALSDPQIQKDLQEHVAAKEEKVKALLRELAD